MDYTVCLFKQVHLGCGLRGT